MYDLDIGTNKILQERIILDYWKTCQLFRYMLKHFFVRGTNKPAKANVSSNGRLFVIFIARLSQESQNCVSLLRSPYLGRHATLVTEKRCVTTQIETTALFAWWHQLVNSSFGLFASLSAPCASAESSIVVWPLPSSLFLFFFFSIRSSFLTRYSVMLSNSFFLSVSSFLSLFTHPVRRTNAGGQFVVI